MHVVLWEKYALGKFSAFLKSHTVRQETLKTRRIKGAESPGSGRMGVIGALVFVSI